MAAKRTFLPSANLNEPASITFATTTSSAADKEQSSVGASTLALAAKSNVAAKMREIIAVIRPSRVAPGQSSSGTIVWRPRAQQETEGRSHVSARGTRESTTAIGGKNAKKPTNRGMKAARTRMHTSSAKTRSQTAKRALAHLHQ